MAASAQRVDPRSRRTSGALLRAAEEVFAERPAEEVTVEDLAQRAGVAVSSIYNHFGSKSGLHAAVVERALEVDRTFMDGAFAPGRTPREQVRAAADAYLRFYLEYPEYFRMLAFPGDPGQYPAGRKVAANLARRVREQNQRLAEALRQADEGGEARVADPELAATFLWASWNGLLSLAWRPDSLRHDERQLRRLLAYATEVVERGLSAAGS